MKSYIKGGIQAKGILKTLNSNTNLNYNNYTKKYLS